MFDKKFSTSTVNAEIELDIQLILWGMIDSWKKQRLEVDYLQVFELSIIESNGRWVQKVKHKQEVPPRKQELTFRVFKPINSRIWIVDNGDDEGNAVMMYPSEY